jgi:hypothetical protein
MTPAPYQQHRTDPGQVESRKLYAAVESQISKTARPGAPGVSASSYATFTHSAMQAAQASAQILHSA